MKYGNVYFSLVTKALETIFKPSSISEIGLQFAIERLFCHSFLSV